MIDKTTVLAVLAGILAPALSIGLFIILQGL